jgi:hypothetical protein
MKKLRYICVQPRLLYYAWQVEVMINNFIDNGINQYDIDILVSINQNDETSIKENIEAWDVLKEKYTNVNFYFYEDTRQKPTHYISSIRPNILKQHFKNNLELSQYAYFYHDCDIIFTRPVDFSNLLNDDKWYSSNTNSYINYDYIVSKGYNVYETMCDIVGIDYEIPKRNNVHSGGAQYILKNLHWTFWDKVERDSEQLFYKINNLNNEVKKEKPEYHELQIWCADMWAVLWNGWLFGNEMIVTNELEFCWPTDMITKWDSCPIYHNAGVTNDTTDMFYKGKYFNKFPDDINFDLLKTNVCSYKYSEQILKTQKISCLI